MVSCKQTPEIYENNSVKELFLYLREREREREREIESRN
jgi:hypothetical protein